MKNRKNTEMEMKYNSNSDSIKMETMKWNLPMEPTAMEICNSEEQELRVKNGGKNS